MPGIGPNIIRTCVVCGEKFHPKSTRQKSCNKPIELTCPICGKKYPGICTIAHQKATCSPECQVKMIKQKREASAKLSKKICKWCGKEFIPKTVRDEYCQDTHYQTCVVCGKEFVIEPRKDKTVKTCSKECRYIEATRNKDIDAMKENLKQTMLAKYGVENIMHVDGISDRIKQTNLERYGTEWYTQTAEYKEKVRETDLEKYGVEHHLQSPEVVEKRKETVQRVYGVDNVFQNEAIKEKSRESCIERFGVPWATQNEDIKEQTRETNFAKYGAAHPMMLKEFQDKAAATNERLYGRKAYTQQHISKIEEWYQFIDDPKSFTESHFEYPPSSYALSRYFDVDQSTIDVYLTSKDAWGAICTRKSKMEEEIGQFIHSIRPDVTIVHNDRATITPLELDILIPEMKLAIECNPTCTHNSSAFDPWGGEPKSIRYHMHKTDECEKKGIMLFHVFGYEWTHKSDIILGMISNLLKSNSSKIYARKCTISEVTGTEASAFLNANHRQGAANSSTRLGLYYEGELVSLMTFGKMRATIGSPAEDGTFELVRFCSKLGTTVTGGASRLFKHFIDQYSPSSVISFSDRAHTSGTLYPSLGFTEIRRSDPGYVWVEVASDRAYNRVNAQKSHIKDFLKDPSIDTSRTEREIMEEHGFVRVFDSGTITWEWTQESLYR